MMTKTHLYMLLAFVMLLSFNMEGLAQFGQKEPDPTKQRKPSVGVNLAGISYAIFDIKPYNFWNIEADVTLPITAKPHVLHGKVELGVNSYYDDYSGPFTLWEGAPYAHDTTVSFGWYEQRTVYVAPGLIWSPIRVWENETTMLRIFTTASLGIGFAKATIAPDIVFGGLNRKTGIIPLGNCGLGFQLQIGEHLLFEPGAKYYMTESAVDNGWQDKILGTMNLRFRI